MRYALSLVSLLLVYTPAALGHPPPLLPQSEVAALVDELSGETARINLEGISASHRMRGSQGFHAAAAWVADRARAYGLEDVQILQFPADGKIMYGTQRSRPAWDASEAELSEVKAGTQTRLSSYAADPVALAEDSESGEVTTTLIDAGDGTTEADYSGKDVAGRIVLVAAQPGDAQDLAVGKYHAAGMISYAQNQKTAWSGTDESLVRWGHLKTFSPDKAFAFMVSLKVARELKARLSAGETIRLHARVRAGQHAGFYEVVTARIAGADPVLKEQEIAFSCHLDHQRPGANDNASGCAAILEVARTLQKLIATGKLARPARTLRFIWPPEIEGTLALLNAQPSVAQRIKAVVHMDMVGGGPKTKAVFHVTRGPESLPSFVHDVGWTFAAFLNQETYEYAATGSAEYPMTSAEGGREPLRAEYSPYEMGSDHDVYQDSSFGIPAIYLNDWPDRFIHTNFDSAGNIDPTKLKRAALIGAASGYFLANLSDRDAAAVEGAVALGSLLRTAQSIERGSAPETARRAQGEYERAILASLDVFLGKPGNPPPMLRSRAGSPGTSVFRRVKDPRGPLAVFGYDYFDAHAQSMGVPIPRLLSYQGAWGAGGEYAYEALNFADGRHTTQQVCDKLSAEYGPVPLEMVVEYLNALQAIGVVERL
jgi:aminopeptidase YwaD